MREGSRGESCECNALLRPQPRSSHQPAPPTRQLVGERAPQVPHLPCQAVQRGRVADGLAAGRSGQRQQARV